MKKAFLIIFLLMGVGLTSLSVVYYKSNPILEPFDLELATGQSLSSFCGKLTALELVQNRMLCQLSIRLFSDYRQFQSGFYRIETEVSLQQIATQLRSGKVHNELVWEFIIPEGYTIAQITDKLRTHKPHLASEFYQLAFDPKYVDSFRIDRPSLEGFLYPATYKFYNKDPSAEQLIREMVDTFFQKLPRDYRSQAAELGLTLEEAVIFASLIEKEASIDQERTMIAEVIWNRLKKRIPLGIDASLIYGIIDYKGNIRVKHLKDRSNLYNSRIHRGLPPGPIASPSIASLMAVFKPTSFGYLYYVLVPGKNKNTHHFSKSLKEHNRWVRKLTRYQKANR